MVGESIGGSPAALPQRRVFRIVLCAAKKPTTLARSTKRVEHAGSADLVESRTGAPGRALTGLNFLRKRGALMATETNTSSALTSPGHLVPFIILTALFFIFGFITNLNMGLVPYLRNIFEVQKLQVWEAMLANGAFFTAYLVCSAPTSKLIEAIGYKRTIVVSLFVQVVGALLFVPAAKYVSFPLFLIAIFVVGAGVAALQTSANPYVSILGPEHSAPVRLNLAQAFNSIGGSIAPWVAGTFFLTAAVLSPDQVALKSAADQHAYQVAIADTVRIPYLVIAFGLILLGIAVAFLHLPHIEATQSFRPAKAGDPLLNRSILSYKHTVLGA